MPLELAWFLGTVLMLTGAVTGGILWSVQRKNSQALRSRVSVNAEVTSVDPPSSEDLGGRGCTVQYSVKGHRYQISAELDPAICKVGLPVSVMVLPSMPSDGVLLQDLAPVSFGKPLALFIGGAALVAWPYGARLW